MPSAIKMYEELGFRQQGVRRRYYTDNGEDALIMWSEELSTHRVPRQRLDAAKRALRERVRWEHADS